LLLIRLSLASVFIFHGILKLTNMAGTIDFFSTLGLGVFFAWLVAILEVVSGGLMLLGLWTHVAGIILAIIMFFSIILAKSKSGLGFLSFEFEFVLRLVALGIAMAGPGRWAVNCPCGNCKDKCGSSCGCHCDSCNDGNCKYQGKICSCENSMCSRGKNTCDGCEGCKENCTGHERN